MAPKRKTHRIDIPAVAPLVSEPKPKRQCTHQSSDLSKSKVICACGCQRPVSLKTQKRHLNGNGPLWVRIGRSESASTSEDAVQHDFDYTNPWATNQDPDLDAEADANTGETEEARDIDRAAEPRREPEEDLGALRRVDDLKDSSCIISASPEDITNYPRDGELILTIQRRKCIR
jgi:hypothetical protein